MLNKNNKLYSIKDDTFIGQVSNKWYNVLTINENYIIFWNEYGNPVYTTSVDSFLDMSDFRNLKLKELGL